MTALGELTPLEPRRLSAGTGVSRQRCLEHGYGLFDRKTLVLLRTLPLRLGLQYGGELTCAGSV